MWHECITYPEDPPPEAYSEPEAITPYYHARNLVGRRDLISQNCSSHRIESDAHEISCGRPDISHASEISGQSQQSFQRADTTAAAVPPCSSVSFPHVLKTFGAIAAVSRPYISNPTSSTACFPVNLADPTLQAAPGMDDQRTLEGGNSQEQPSIAQLPALIRYDPISTSP